MVRVYTLLMWFLAFGVFAQSQNRIDSLRLLLPAKSGKELFDLLSNLAWEYRLVIPDSAIQVGKRAYEMGKKLELKKDLARPVNFIGVGYEYKGLVGEAYDFYNEALNVASNQEDNLQIAYANNNLGRLFLDQGNAIKSHEAHQTALTIFESLNDLAGVAYVYLNLAKLYSIAKGF